MASSNINKRVSTRLLIWNKEYNPFFPIHAFLRRNPRIIIRGFVVFFIVGFFANIIKLIGETDEPTNLLILHINALVDTIQMVVLESDPPRYFTQDSAWAFYAAYFSAQILLPVFALYGIIEGFERLQNQDEVHRVVTNIKYLKNHNNECKLIVFLGYGKLAAAWHEKLLDETLNNNSNADGDDIKNRCILRRIISFKFFWSRLSRQCLRNTPLILVVDISPEKTSNATKNTNTFGLALDIIDSEKKEELIKGIIECDPDIIYVDLGKDELNYQVIRKLNQIPKDKKETSDSKHRKVLVHITDDNYEEAVYEIEKNIIVTSVSRISARLLLGTHPPCRVRSKEQPPVHILLAGYGWIGDALLKQIILTCHYFDHRPVHITIVATDASLLQQKIEKKWPALSAIAKDDPGYASIFPIAHVRCIETDPSNLTLKQLQDICRTENEPIPLQAAYIISDNDIQNKTIVQRLLQLRCLKPESFYSQYIITQVLNAIDTLTFKKNDEADVRVFDITKEIKDKINTPYGYPGQELDHIGMYIHHSYSNKKLGPEELWRKAQPFERLSSNACADHLWPKLWQLQANFYTRNTQDQAKHIPYFTYWSKVSDNDIEILKNFADSKYLKQQAEAEHRRFCAERAMFRWLYSKENKKLNKLNSTLVRYDELEKDVKGRICDSFNKHLDALKKRRYLPFKKVFTMAPHPKIFRVFVSSTFGDFQIERQILQSTVFPNLKTACEARGFKFLGVDLRWGISPERSTNNQTMQTCLEEINRCQRITPRPNFLILLGQRYGWLPPAESIPDRLYVQLHKWLAEHKPSYDTSLIDACYRKDENAEQPTWLLKPQHELKLDKLEPKPRDWHEAANVIKHNLAEAAEALQLSDEEKILFTASATHQEIQRGLLLLPPESQHQVFAWRRLITDLDKSNNVCNKFVDDSDQLTTNPQLEALASKLKGVLQDRYTDRETTLSELNKPIEKELNGYHKAFADQVFDALLTKILEQIDSYPNYKEEEVHRAFAKERSSGFISRKNELQKIKAYLNTTAEKPYLLKAPGGIGKTSLLAKLVSDTAEEQWLVRFSGASARIGDPLSLLRSLWPDDAHVYEFLEQNLKKSTEREVNEFIKKTVLLDKDDLPAWLRDKIGKLDKNSDTASSNLRLEVLQGLLECTKQHREELLADMVAGVLERREVSLTRYLGIISNLHGKKKMVLVIDALDQLSGLPDLGYLLGRLGNIVSDGSTVKLPDNVWLIASQRDEEYHDLAGFSPEEARILIDQRLKAAKRKLTLEQDTWIMNGFKNVPVIPLVLKLTIERALRMRSFDPVPQQTQFSTEDAIDALYSYLNLPEQHGLLGWRALSYLAFARSGLPEEVLLDALAADTEVAEWFVEQTKANNQETWPLERGLPPILWSRLHMDLDPYLVLRFSHGSPALHFFHREFHEQAKRYSLNKVQSTQLARNLARAAWKRLVPKDSPGLFDTLSLPPDLYKIERLKQDGWALAELPWLLEQAGLEGASRQFLELPAFVLAKLEIHDGVRSLTDDYERLNNSQQGESEWARLFLRLNSSMLLAPTPRKFFLQHALGLPSTPQVKNAMQAWMKSGAMQDHWLCDSLEHPNPRFEIELAKNTLIHFKILNNGKVAAWSSHNDEVNAKRIRFLDPDNPTALVKFLEVKLPGGFPSGPDKKGLIKDIRYIPNLKVYLTLHDQGPMNIWHGETCIANLIDILTQPANDDLKNMWSFLEKVSKNVPPQFIEYKGELSVIKLINETNGSLLSIYDNGLVVRWTLPEDLNEQYARDNKQVEIRTDCEYASILAEDENISDEFNKSIKRYYIDSHQQGKRTTLLFAIPNESIRIVTIDGDEVKQFYSETTLSGLLEKNRYVVLDAVVYAQHDINKVIRHTAEGEIPVPLELSQNDIIHGLWGDKSGGLVVVVSGVDDKLPFCLKRFKPDGTLHWTREGLCTRTPYLLESGQFIFFLTDDGLKARRMEGDFEEIAFSINEIPENIQETDTGHCLAWKRSRLHSLNLKNGESWSCDTGKEITQAVARVDDFLVAHDDGYLRSWTKACAQAQGNAVVRATCVVELLDGSVLSCAGNSLTLWIEADSKPESRTVWSCSEKESYDCTNTVEVVAADEVITFGDRFIRVWSVSAQAWTLKQVINWPNELKLKNAPIVGSMLVDKKYVLFEYGCGIDGRGEAVGRIQKMYDGVWIAEPLNLPLDIEWKYHQLLTPVMANGDVLFLTLPDSPGEYERYTLYDLKSSQMSMLKADDPVLRQWLIRHKNALSEHIQCVRAQLERWTESIAFGNGERLSKLAGALLPAPEAFNTVDSIKNLVFLLREFPASEQIAIRQNKMLGYCSLNNIGVLDGETQHCLANDHASGHFRLWVNHLSRSGRLYLTDREARLRILQLMRGASPAKTQRADH